MCLVEESDVCDRGKGPIEPAAVEGLGQQAPLLFGKDVVGGGVALGDEVIDVGPKILRLVVDAVGQGTGWRIHRIRAARGHALTISAATTSWAFPVRGLRGLFA